MYLLKLMTGRIQKSVQKFKKFKFSTFVNTHRFGGEFDKSCQRQRPAEKEFLYLFVKIIALLLALHPLAFCRINCN